MKIRMTTQVQIRVSEKERAELQRAADMEHLTLSAFIRRLAMLEIDRRKKPARVAV